MAIVRILDLSHHQAKLINGVRVVTANIALAVEASASGFITRSNYGERVDTTAKEHNRRIDAIGSPRAFYWYDLSRKDPKRMAEIAFEQSGSIRGRRGYCDLEENRRADGADPVFPPKSAAYFNHVNVGLLRCDELSGVITGIYSNSFLDAYFTMSQQRVWADAGRPLWVAHWAPPGPGIPYVPAGWRHLLRPWSLWQDRVGPWPGFLEGDVDQNQVRSGLDLKVIFGDGVVLPPPPPPPPADDDSALRATIREHASEIDRLANG